MESWQAGHVVLMQRQGGIWREVGRVLKGRAPRSDFLVGRGPLVVVLHLS